MGNREGNPTPRGQIQKTVLSIYEQDPTISPLEIGKMGVGITRAQAVQAVYHLTQKGDLNLTPEQRNAIKRRAYDNFPAPVRDRVLPHLKTETNEEIATAAGVSYHSVASIAALARRKNFEEARTDDQIREFKAAASKGRVRRVAELSNIIESTTGQRPSPEQEQVLDLLVLMRENTRKSNKEFPIFCQTNGIVLKYLPWFERSVLELLFRRHLWQKSGPKTNDSGEVPSPERIDEVCTKADATILDRLGAEIIKIRDGFSKAKIGENLSRGTSRTVFIIARDGCAIKSNDLVAVGERDWRDYPDRLH